MSDKIRKVKQQVDRRGWFVLVSLCVIIFLSGFFLNSLKKPAQAMTSPDTSIYFNPASTSVAIGESFSLDAMISPGSSNEISSALLNIRFDHATLKLNSVTVNSAAFPITFAGPTINNDQGWAELSVGIVPVASPTYVTTITTIATFNFTVLAANPNSRISFDGSTVAMAHGHGSDNVVTILTGAEIAVLDRTYGNADFALLAADWFKMDSSPADINSDGRVDTRDLGIMMSNWE